MRRRAATAAAVTALVLSVTTGTASAAPVTPANAATGPFQVLDQQNWKNPADMTWADYRAVPNKNWADPTVRGSVRNFKTAMITVDYPDQTFVVSQPAGSTIFGNPAATAADIPRDQVTKFYADMFNTPGTLNKGHTLHEYWMQDSNGRYGVDLAGFGPYRMPAKSYQYGITDSHNLGGCPSGETCNQDLAANALSAWKAAVGQQEASKYELVVVLSAGQDETSTWQEFGQMMFQNKEDVPDAWGPPDPTLPNYTKTRYVEWTSWKSAATVWPWASGGSVIQGETGGLGTFAHELSHLLNIGDNYGNPFGTPLRRDYSGTWDMLSRGAFNGPGGPHTRWAVPAVAGGSMGALHTLRDKLKIGLLGEENVLRVSREALASSGMVVLQATARAVDPGPNGLTGVNIALDQDRSPACNVSTDLMCDGGGYNNYTVEVVDRMGADSFTADDGVLISKTKNADDAPSKWVIDANPQDIDMVDFYKPDGTPQKITMGDYRQLSDALFHAGTNSGSEYEYIDQANRLHFYILDVKRDASGILSYTVAVKSLDGAGPSQHGVALAGGTAGSGNPGAEGVTCTFPLTNTGTFVSGGQQHPEDATAYLKSDVYRLSASVAGKGWRVDLPNALASAQFGGSTQVSVSAGAGVGADEVGQVTLTATSESDPSKTAQATCLVNRF